MNCPNCHTPYKETDITCIHCGQPLSNASYTPVSGKRTGKRRRFLLPAFLGILVFLIAAGSIGYYFYLKTVKEKCREAVEQMFSYASAMDFSEVEPSYLPEPLKENPNIRNLILEEISKTMEEYNLGFLEEYTDYEQIVDWICDEITASASWEITDVTADYNSCQVTVSTQNTDFSLLPSSIYEKLMDSQNENNSLWNSITSFFSYLFNGDEGNEEENLLSDMQSILEEAVKEAPKTSYSGTITFGIKDRKWTLLTLDENLFYNYYGFPKK